jgi:hypothetical protein
MLILILFQILYDFQIRFVNIDCDALLKKHIHTQLKKQRNPQVYAEKEYYPEMEGFIILMKEFATKKTAYFKAFKTIIKIYSVTVM